MRRPAFQFYPADWRANTKLRRCTFAERGIWLEVMCLFHDADEYGLLRWSLADIAQAVGCRVQDLQSLRKKGVLKGADPGEVCAAYVHQGQHARKPLPPITLIQEQPGPIWYSSRMVLDEHRRQHRGGDTRFGQDRQPGRSPDEIPTHSPTQREGDGSTSSSSIKSVPTAIAVGVPDGTRAAGPPPLPNCPHELIIALYHETLPMCPRVLEWNDTRQGYLRARWRDKAVPTGVSAGYRTVDEGLAHWRVFFKWVAESKFLTGQAEAKPGRPPFCADLEWLLRPTNFAKVVEGRYHEHREAA